MATNYITCQELIKTLKISAQELIDVENFFDSIPDDEWELIEGKDYKVVIQATGLREYTLSGAYTIARYLEATKKQNFWDLIKEWFTHTKRDIRKSFIRNKILGSCSSLVKRNNQFFISRSDVVAIFCTRSDYLKRMADYTQRTQYPLIVGQDYEEFMDEGGLYFSLSGIYKLSLAFEERQTKKNRKEWCKDVGEIVKPQIEDIVAQILSRNKQIQKSINQAKKRDKYTCQVTGEEKNRIEPLKLAAHHLYSEKEYPHLANVEHNLITLTCAVHDQFHQNYMGGSNKPCTIDDFIRFVHNYYPCNTKVVLWLEQQKMILGNQLPVKERKTHVLYLPASRVS